MHERWTRSDRHGTHGLGIDCGYRLGTPVLGSDGAKSIETLEPGDWVWSFVDGKLLTAQVKATRRGVSQPVFRVRSRNRDGYASAKHQVFRLIPTHDPCTEGGHGGDAIWTTEWVPLDQLCRGDLIVTFQGTEDSIDAERTTDDSVPPDLAWLLGLFVADGCLNYDALRIAVYGETRERVITIAARYWHRKGIPHPSAGVIINKASAARWMRSHGFVGKAYEKRVPECVWEWSTESWRAFLTGYADGDAHRPSAAGTADITYKSTSRQLMADIRAMHTLLGDGVNNISTMERTAPIYIGGVRVKNARPLHSFEVRYRNRAAAKLSGGSGKRARDARALVRSWNSAFGVQPVLAVEPAGDSPTYRVEIQDSHGFVADGLVVNSIAR